MGRGASRALRARMQELLGDEGARAEVEPLLVLRAGANMLLPARIGDYTDFYASVYHATNVGRFVQAGESAAAKLQVGADWVSRAGFVHCGEWGGGETAQRADQTSGDANSRCLGPSKALDYELEVGFFVGGAMCWDKPVLSLLKPKQHLFRAVPAERLVGA